MTIDAPNPSANPPGPFRFFQKVDWASFGVTTLVALSVYWLTLASDVGLENSGTFATGAMWPGVPMPPGFPIWTIYGWLFINVIPFSNIAWRLALSSAVAGALTCGMIALMASRIGVLTVENISGLKNLSAKEEKAMRVVCGCVAGLGFGFDGGFWPKAVIADPWALSLFLFTLTLCLLTRWFFAPHQRRYLFMASLAYGLALCNSQSLLAAALGLLFLMTMADSKISREIFFCIGVVLCGVLEANSYLHWFDEFNNLLARNYMIIVAVVVTLMWMILSVRTRRFFSEWKTTSICAALFLIGISAYFLVPIFSMTNPPMDWGYPRTVEGFFHVITRGQYEQINPVNSLAGLVGQLAIYRRIAVDEFGLPYLLAAVIPFCFLFRILSPARKWLIGLLFVWFFYSLLVSVALNTSLDRVSVDAVKPILAGSHIALAMLSGCGLILVVVIFGRPTPARP